MRSVAWSCALGLWVCSLGCGGSRDLADPWSSRPASTTRDTTVAPIAIAPGTHVRGQLLDGRWRSGTAGAVVNDTLQLTDKRDGIPLRGLRALQ